MEKDAKKPTKTNTTKTKEAKKPKKKKKKKKKKRGVGGGGGQHEGYCPLEGRLGEGTTYPLGEAPNGQRIRL